VSVFIRPDKAKLVPVTPGKMRGVVVSSRFVGQKTRLVVRLSEDALIKLELPTGSRDPGESVGVDLSPDELMLFREA
jgi:ABC-type Fe3+/spermidine/putrescine transport system ATPase subunit